MQTFREFRESLNKEDRKKALEVVRKGINLNSDVDFWGMFLSLCGDPEGMSALLGTSRETITGLGGKVRDLVKEIQNKDSSDAKRKKVIKTGDK
jgi:hypothetical protein